MKVKNYEQLISLMMRKTDKEKILFLEKYLLQNFKYYYPTILWRKLHKEIGEKENNNLSVKDARQAIYISNVEELKKLYKKENYNIFKIRTNYISYFTKACSLENFNDDISKTDTAYNFNSFCRKKYKYLNAELKINGLVLQGVYTNLSQFIKKICDDVNIKCEEINGKTPYKHTWNIIELNGKKYHFDMVYALYVKDHFKDWGTKNLKPEDFLMIDEETLQILSPRTIDSQEWGKI